MMDTVVDAKGLVFGMKFDVERTKDGITTIEKGWVADYKDLCNCPNRWKGFALLRDGVWRIHLIDNKPDELGMVVCGWRRLCTIAPSDMPDGMTLDWRARTACALDLLHYSRCDDVHG